MLATVLLPTYGPWLDSDFAGRMPQHDHIFIGEVDLDHHTHENTGRPPQHAEAGEQPPQVQSASISAAVVSLPDRDTLLQSVILVCPDHCIFLQWIETINSPIMEPQIIVTGIVVSPLDEPPRF